MTRNSAIVYASKCVLILFDLIFLLRHRRQFFSLCIVFARLWMEALEKYQRKSLSCLSDYLKYFLTKNLSFICAQFKCASFEAVSLMLGYLRFRINFLSTNISSFQTIAATASSG